MADIVLNVEVREQTGTGATRSVRRSGKVPGVLYGGSKDPVAIAVPANEFRKALYTGKLLGHLVTLKYGEETQPVIAKAIDMHPVTDEPWHFDLYRVDEHQQIKISVPVHFTNHEASPGIKRGGTLNVVLPRRRHPRGAGLRPGRPRHRRHHPYLQLHPAQGRRADRGP